MNRAEMINFIKNRLKSKSDPWLLKDSKNFPNPPSTADWQLLIKDLEASGKIKSQPNGQYFLPEENLQFHRPKIHEQHVLKERSIEESQPRGNQNNDNRITPNPSWTNKIPKILGVLGLIITAMGMILIMILELIKN